MADENDVLIREVDEELQRERMQKLWEQNKTYILGVAAAIIIGVGGFKFMEHQRQVAAEAAGSTYVTAITALRDNKRDEAQKAIVSAGSGHPGLSALGKLRLAAADREAGKNAEALAAFESLAADRSIDPVLSDFARLQTAMLTIDTASWTDTQNRLNALADDKNPWRHQARELLGLAAQKQGDTAAARKQFEMLIGDPATPKAIGERAKMVMAILTEAELAKSMPAPTVTPASSASPTSTAPANTTTPVEPAKTAPATSTPPAPAKKTK
jgi:hypothetical protein